MSTLLAQQLDFSELTPGDKPWGKVTDKGLSFDKDIPFEKWEEITRTAAAMYEGTLVHHVRAMFLLGDALDFGEKAFGEAHAQAIDQTRQLMRLHAKTVENAAWIARSVPPENRREELSFAHHEVVAKLEPPEQKTWLDKAEAEALTVAALKKEVRAAHPSTRTPGNGKTKKAKGDKVTPAEAKEACDSLIAFFSPYIEGGKKAQKITAEMRKTFSDCMTRIYRIARKFTRKENW